MGIWCVCGVCFRASAAEFDAERKGLSSIPFSALHRAECQALKSNTNLFHSGYNYSDD